MHTTRLSLFTTLAALALGLFVFAGCGDSLTMTEATGGDEETLVDFMTDESDLDGIFDDMGPYESGALSTESSGTRDAIDPLTFWRVVTNRACHRDVVINEDKTIAEVTVYRDIWGVLHIVDESMVEYEKPFHHEGMRMAVFVKDEDWDPGNAGESGGNGQGEPQGTQNHYRCGPWVLTEISGFKGESDTLTAAIDWIRIQSATVDITVTDPLALMTVPDEIPAFAEGEDVTVTVSGPIEGSNLFLHTRRWKSPLAPEPDGTFAGTWTVSRRGRHTAWIEAMAPGTLHDSEHPEDTLIWGMPYVVLTVDDVE